MSRAAALLDTTVMRLSPLDNRGLHDNEVQFLYRKSPAEALKCQLCDEDLGKQSETERQNHYEQHFSEQSQHPAQPPLPSSSSSMKSPKNVFWHPSMHTAAPDNFTPDLIPLLRKSLSISHQRGNTRKAFLCHSEAVHVGSEPWDRGWGCGYRNFLMVCIPLIEQKSQPAYSALLKDPMPPGVQNLQLWIENAWATGYDAEGAQQLHRKLVDTKKWIGTADLYVAFTSRGIPCRLVDFQFGAKGSEDKLVDWVINYFDPPMPHPPTVNEALRGAQAISVTDRMPVVLQHDGHSRTIIGYEVTQTGSINLLMFDPSKSLKSFVRKAALTKSFTANSKFSPKKLSSRIKQSMMRSFEEIKSKKRKHSGGDSNDTTPKRSRGERDVIVIDDEGDEHSQIRLALEDSSAGLDEVYKEILKLTRVKTTALRLKNKYQVLYFPLLSPLTDEDKLARQVVKSVKI